MKTADKAGGYRDTEHGEFTCRGKSTELETLAAHRVQQAPNIAAAIVLHGNRTIVIVEARVRHSRQAATTTACSVLPLPGTVESWPTRGQPCLQTRFPSRAC